ncbi:MAG: TetR/AcrR family transcriptional regulator [Rhizobiaceae bacterium]
MEAFWARGYEATSMADLVSATGINRGSIYAAFTDKHTLFVRALKHYDQHHRSDFLANIRRAHGPKEAILAVFRSAIASADGERSRSGCLLVNTALELSPHDEEVDELIRASFVELEGFFKSAIKDAQRDGDIDNNKDPVETAQALLGLFLGLRVLSRSRPEKSLLNSISKQAAMLME